MRLENEVVIVTGGASGLGSVYCKFLVYEGAHVVIADINDEQSNVLKNELNSESKSKGGSASVFKVDVTSEQGTEELANATIAKHGRIDVLINNAGIYPHVDFDQITYEAWRNVFTMNTDSVFLCTKAVLPHMKKRETGKIINVVTNLVWIGLPSMVHYVASKAAIIGFTRSLARELAGAGITVNALAPGAVMPPLDTLNKQSRKRAEEIVARQCVQWPQQAEDLVGPMLFLASSDSDFMSGQIVTVDGGLTNH